MTTMSSAIDSIKTGDNIRVTVLKPPASLGGRRTVLRLMRRDPAVARRLRAGQKRRGQTLNVYIRGNRKWVARERCGSGDRVYHNTQFTMAYTPDLAGEFRSVEQYLKIEKA